MCNIPTKVSALCTQLSVTEFTSSRGYTHNQNSCFPQSKLVFPSRRKSVTPTCCENDHCGEVKCVLCATEFDRFLISCKTSLISLLHSGGYSPLVGATAFPGEKQGFSVKTLVWLQYSGEVAGINNQPKMTENQLGLSHFSLNLLPFPYTFL